VFGIPWKTALREEVSEECWQLFEDVFVRVYELLILMRKKSVKEGRRPACLNKDLLIKLKWKKEKNRQWNQGCVPWEESRDAAWTFE